MILTLCLIEKLGLEINLLLLFNPESFSLVDEFQDTDPLEYELILYVAEKSNREARVWSEIQLEPGKLFIVGDPKQSIYAFRRADIEAYDSVIHDLVLGQIWPKGATKLTQ